MVPWSLFDGLPDEYVRRLRQAGTQRAFARGQVVFWQDDPADTLFLVESGRFVVKAGIGSDHAALTILGPGEVFGELALLSEDARRSATVEALESSRALGIPRREFERLRSDFPEPSAAALISILARQVRRLSRHLVEGLYVDKPVLVLRRLHELAVLYRDGTETTTVPHGQQLLAEMAGTTRATANRALKDAERQGLITLGRNRVVVLHIDGLAASAGALPLSPG